jgi:hypothetical protein
MVEQKIGTRLRRANQCDSEMVGYSRHRWATCWLPERQGAKNDDAIGHAAPNILSLDRPHLHGVHINAIEDPVDLQARHRRRVPQGK